MERRIRPVHRLARSRSCCGAPGSRSSAWSARPSVRRSATSCAAA